MQFIATGHIKRPCHSGVLEPAEALQPHHEWSEQLLRDVIRRAGVNTKIGRGGPRVHDLRHYAALGIVGDPSASRGC